MHGISFLARGAPERFAGLQDEWPETGVHRTRSGKKTQRGGARGLMARTQETRIGNAAKSPAEAGSGLESGILRVLFARFYGIFECFRTLFGAFCVFVFFCGF